MIRQVLSLYVVSLLLVACSGDIGVDEEVVSPVPVDPAIETFVASFSFPKQQDIKSVLLEPQERVQVFTVEYGHPNDCISGCFYSRGEGVLYGEKIGWISIDDYDGLDLPGDYLYDFNSSDTYLFTEKFYEQLTNAHGWLDHGPFMYLLAGDEDTPYVILLKYAERIVGQRGLGYLASVLLSNPAVQTDESILTLLADLPLEYSEYRDAISDAEYYLAQL